MTCLLHYGYIFLASLSGAGLGTFLVLRLWKTGELDTGQERR